MANPTDPFDFVRVEKFFGTNADYRGWNNLKEVARTSGVRVGTWTPAPDPYTYSADPRNTDPLRVNDYKVTVFVGDYSIVVDFLTFNTFRVRFDPAVRDGKYPVMNSRAVVMEDTVGLRESLNYRPQSPKSMFKVIHEEKEDGKHVFSTSESVVDGRKSPTFLILEVETKPAFRLLVKQRLAKGEDVVAFNADDLYFSENGFKNPTDFQVVQSVVKPAGAKYLGFGEQGGKHLAKNQEQLTYFNYDNMRYQQVYGKGPMESREPLYHSDPFFIELNGTLEETVYGIYIDNPSQILVDVGYLHSQRYLFGTRFGGLDYYFFLGVNVAEITKAFSSIIGRSKLKPRYVLGYHQGCYGYDTKQKVEDAARGYRYNDIPLDGLHVDVDIQKNYQTFTIDEGAFPDPKGMFDYLRSIGVKCSTNITPIISDKDPSYLSFTDGLQPIYDRGRTVHKFIKESRYGDWKDVNIYQDYEYKDFGQSHKVKPADIIFNNGSPYYVGEVYYGDNADGTPRGTTGHYPNLYSFPVRKWWGQQYKYLFEMGLEFVWQDMTTPAIRATRGDYKSFPLKLLVDSDWLRPTLEMRKQGIYPDPIPVIRVWNLFSYNLHKATYHGLVHLPGRGEKRNFIIGRGSFSGMHRYAGLWTGDNSSTWDFYRINVSQALALGICGMVINGQDIGGFETEGSDKKWVDPELLIRWTSTGAFLPWFRNHYQAKNGVKYFQEPWRFPRTEEELNQYHIPQDQRYLYRTVLPACKYYIELRYRLLQLFYDAMFENMFSGLPISRALVLVEPQDRTLYNDNLSRLSDQFFVGQDLMVAPVLHPDRSYPEHSIYLPYPSRWFLFKNNRSKLDRGLVGGTTVREFDAKIYDDPNHIPFILPIFIRAGAIIPTIEKENWVSEFNSKGKPNPITFNVYPGRNVVRNRDLIPWAKDLYQWTAPKVEDVDGEYHLFLDDGESVYASPDKLPQFRSDYALKDLPEEKKSQYRHTYITHKTVDKVKTITFNRIWERYTPPFEKYFFVAILHEIEEPQDPLISVKVNGVAINRVPGADELNNAPDNAWYWNSDLHISFVKVSDNNKTIAVAATYK